MVMSWLGFWGVITLDREPQHLLENYATQGVVFAAAAVCAIFIFAESGQAMLQRAVLFVFVICFVGNILFVLGGRSGYLFLLISMAGAGYMLFPRYRKLAGVIGFSVVLLGLVASDNSRSRILIAFQEANAAFDSEAYTNLGVRIVMWTNTIALVRESPLIGTGAGAFEIRYEDQVKDATGWRALVTDDPHQQYLHIAAEYGIVGLAIFVGGLICCALTRQTSPYVCSGLIVLAATAANGFANGHFSAFVEGRLLWIMLGALLAASQLSKGMPDMSGHQHGSR